MKLSDARQLFAEQMFNCCPLLPTRSFLEFCRDQNVSTSRMESLNKLSLFSPVVLAEPPDPTDEMGNRDNVDTAPSLYSQFQCYPLFNLMEWLTVSLSLDQLSAWTDEETSQVMIRWRKYGQNLLTALRASENKRDKAALICQSISDRYYPLTQSDERTIRVSSVRHDWDWYEFCHHWKAQDVQEELNLDLDELREIQEVVAFDASMVDPLARWSDLVRFVAIEKKLKLKGKALLAQTLYAMEGMLSKFYEELTGKRPERGLRSEKETERIYGAGVSGNVLSHLEYVSNSYHLNPRPRLILVVEGDGEFVQIPTLVEHLYGFPLSTVEIELVNLRGIGNFTGRKRDRFGALSRFIDAFHDRQTIVYVLLDNEGGAEQIRARLIEADSKYSPYRKITKPEYLHIWDRNIEFDNFTNIEIADELSSLASCVHSFVAAEVEVCRSSFGQEGHNLERLYSDKVDQDLDKAALLGNLFSLIRTTPTLSGADTARPVVQVLRKVVELAALNHQPTSSEDWNKNQQSGYVGSVSSGAKKAG